MARLSARSWTASGGARARVPARDEGGGGETERGWNAVPVVTMKQLLEAGVHFGHQTRRWNPKMGSFIFTQRNGIHIIDLQKSVPLIEGAYKFVRETVAAGGSVLFVGTKKQAQDAIREESTASRSSWKSARTGRWTSCPNGSSPT